MIRLTQKKAIDISIELWTWLAETGISSKGAWSGWKMYGESAWECALCEWEGHQNCKTSVPVEDIVCPRCPYGKKFGFCAVDGKPYWNWTHALSATDRKRHAAAFLEQLKTLRA